MKYFDEVLKYLPIIILLIGFEVRSRGMIDSWTTPVICMSAFALAIYNKL